MNPDEHDVLLAAVGQRTVLDRQKDCGVRRRGSVINYGPGGVVPAEDGEVAKITPMILKMPKVPGLSADPRR